MPKALDEESHLIHYIDYQDLVQYLEQKKDSIYWKNNEGKEEVTEEEVLVKRIVTESNVCKQEIQNFSALNYKQLLLYKVLSRAYKSHVHERWKLDKQENKNKISNIYLFTYLLQR